MLWFIIVTIVIGFIAGLIARAILPGNDSMGLLATTVLGIVGSLVGGFLGYLLLENGIFLIGVTGFRVVQGRYLGNHAYGIFPRCSTDGWIAGNLVDAQHVAGGADSLRQRPGRAAGAAVAGSDGIAPPAKPTTR